jgi:valyl-tRNA synthetase
MASESSEKSTKSELAPKYDPAAVEARVFAEWMEQGCFTADPSAGGEPYCIVIPPPNVTGALHLGHALNNTLQDILIRTHRMKGFNVLWVPGVDHAGIATQAVVEKQLRENENKTRHDVGRDGLVERIWAWKQQYGDRIVEQLKRMGCSCDWSRLRFTLDDMCAGAVRETFFKMFRDGKVFRGKRLVNWDTHLQTSISDDELYTETVKTSLWPIRYPIDGTDKFLTIATTRPETMLADTAVAVHPEDPRWNWAIGKQVRLPLTGRLIPIIADPILVDMNFGTGCVKVTPGHDPNDYAVYTRHKGTASEIGVLNLMTPDGKVNDADPSWSAFTGLTFAAARKKVVEDLIAGGFLTESEIKPHEANVNFSDRSKTTIQPYLSDQWFVRMAQLAEPALQVVRDGTIKFFPERHGQQYLAWLGEKRDWPISRQLWWGHRIPVWSGDGGKARAYAALPGVTIAEFDGRAFVCVDRDDNPAVSRLETDGFVRDPDVLDTWFSSGLWPHSVLGWPEKTDELAKWYPGAVLLTGRDIITLWVARMVMMGQYNMAGQIPFKHVAINPTILDGKGERMSKSKGNGVDPVDIIDTHGADAMRFTLATMATETQDVRMPVKKDASGRNTSEKFDLGRNFCTKLWNAARFAMAQIESAPAPVAGGETPLVEKWILSRLAATLGDIELALATYRFDLYAKAVYDFFWRDICDWYVEALKPVMKDPARAGNAAATLAAVLDAALRLLHPITPFITEAIWEKLNSVQPDRSIPGLRLPPSAKLVKAAWPTPPVRDEGAEAAFGRIQELVAAIRTIRNENKIEPKRVLPVLLIDTDLDVTAGIGLVELLANAKVELSAGSRDAAPGAVRSTAAGIELHVAGVVDPNAAAGKDAKRRDELAKLVATLEGRLASPSYTDKAPPALVEQTRQQLVAARAELAKLA